MRPDSIALVQASFTALSEQRYHVALEFYHRLFAADPDLKSMFTSDLRHQSERLMNMLSHIVAGLDEFDSLIGLARELGARHVVYGVREAHYETEGCALIDTLADLLGDQFTDDVRAAWHEAYDALSGVMIEGASDACAYAA